MLHALELPGDQEPTGHATHTADEGAASTDDMDPAEHAEHRHAPEREYEPAQHAIHPTLPRFG